MSSFSGPDRHRTPTFTTRATHLGTSRPDLERDSGFSGHLSLFYLMLPEMYNRKVDVLALSDASSEYLSTVDVTDSEDPGWKGSIVRSVQDTAGPQVAVMGGSYTGLSPMIIMNNFVLKQPSVMTPEEKELGFTTPVEVMPPSQVVLLQPMASNSSSSPPKTGSENIRQSKSYMPILKSYPKIAPHSADKPTKRLASSRLRASSKSIHDQQKKRHYRGHRLYNSSRLQPARRTTVKPFSNFQAASNESQATERQGPLSDSSLSPYTSEFMPEIDGNRVPAEEHQDPSSIDGDKVKRFSNTYNILNKCGLLEITMRTKQLIQENKCTQGQLQQLQEQTALLLEALSSGDPHVWSKLQLSLQHTDKEQREGKGHKSLE